jgi:hypothetical protein
MPRPGEVSSPLYEGLPYGANALANDMSEDIPDDDLFDDGFDELADFNPQSTSEQFLFSGTDRPDEPLTAGMTFGDGPDFTRFAHESNADLLNRVADRLGADPTAPKEVRAFAERVKRGF